MSQTQPSTWVDHIEGTFPADDLRRAFVAGAQWCFWELEGATMFSSERRAAEDAAEDRYPGGRPPNPPVADATRACILAIGLDRLERTAAWDGYMRAILEDYRRLKVQDIGSRTVPTLPPPSE